MSSKSDEQEEIQVMTVPVNSTEKANILNKLFTRLATPARGNTSINRKKLFKTRYFAKITNSPEHIPIGLWVGAIRKRFQNLTLVEVEDELTKIYFNTPGEVVQACKNKFVFNKKPYTLKNSKKIDNRKHTQFNLNRCTEENGKTMQNETTTQTTSISKMDLDAY